MNKPVLVNDCPSFARFIQSSRKEQVSSIVQTMFQLQTQLEAIDVHGDMHRELAKLDLTLRRFDSPMICYLLNGD